MKSNHLKVASRVFEIESKAVFSLIDKLDGDFVAAVNSILNASGRTIICGMGKSGIVGKKISATLSSTGTPSIFMHPGEAYHGDLGMVTSDDVFISISNSGETDEVVKLLPFLKDNGNVHVSISGNPTSTLALAADFYLNISVEREACPLQLAPTASTTATLAMGDALAVSLMEARGFKPESFARFHPGGSLGRRLLSKVDNEMIRSPLPLVDSSASLMDVIKVITQSSLGLAIVSLENGWAIVTDGDVRRALEKYRQNVFDLRASDIMTRDPVHVMLGTRTDDALSLMDRRQISSILVMDGVSLAGIFKK
jgi:arabinose-5-phosphate isomerase